MALSRRRVWALVFAGIAVLALAAGLGLIVLAMSLLQPGDGDAIAHDRLRPAVAALEDDFYATAYAPSRTGEELAALIPEGSDALRIVPLRWEGTLGSPEPDSRAVLDVRADARVEAHSPTHIGERGNSAGAASGCFRLEASRWTIERIEKIDCPDGPDPVRPTLAPDPSLPGDADALLSAALVDPAVTAATAPDTVRPLFADLDVTVEAVDDQERLVVAVGIVGGRDCRVAVREAGEVTFASYDPTWLLPGELGCSVRLVTAPPL